MQTLVAVFGLLSAMESRLRRVTKRYGFVVDDLPVVGLIHVNQFGEYRNSVTGSLIAERLGRHRQSVQLSLKRLEAAELIEAFRDDNGHATEWRLSQEGVEAWERLVEDLARIEREVFMGKAKEVAQELDGMLDRLRRATFLDWVGVPSQRLSEVDLVDLAKDAPVRKPRSEFDQRFADFAGVTGRRSRF